MFDPASVLETARRSGAQYLATDTHWRPEAMELVAERLAAFVTAHAAACGRREPGTASRSARSRTRVTPRAMLDLPTGQRLYPPERVVIRRVVERRTAAPGDPIARRRRPRARRQLHATSIRSRRWAGATSAGLVEQLSYALEAPVDRIVQNDDGAFATREMLREAGPERLAGKRVVIWQFAARELAGGNWKIE